MRPSPGGESSYHQLTLISFIHTQPWTRNQESKCAQFTMFLHLKSIHKYSDWSTIQLGRGDYQLFLPSTSYPYHPTPFYRKSPCLRHLTSPVLSQGSSMVYTIPMTNAAHFPSPCIATTFPGPEPSQITFELAPFLPIIP